MHTALLPLSAIGDTRCCPYSWCVTTLCSSCTAAPTTCCSTVYGDAIHLLPMFYIVLGCRARLLLSMVSVVYGDSEPLLQLSMVSVV